MLPLFHADSHLVDLIAAGDETGGATSETTDLLTDLATGFSTSSARSCEDQDSTLKAAEGALTCPNLALADLCDEFAGPFGIFAGRCDRSCGYCSSFMPTCSDSGLSSAITVTESQVTCANVQEAGLCSSVAGPGGAFEGLCDESCGLCSEFGLSVAADPPLWQSLPFFQEEPLLPFFKLVTQWRDFVEAKRAGEDAVFSDFFSFDFRLRSTDGSLLTSSTSSTSLASSTSLTPSTPSLTTADVSGEEVLGYIEAVASILSSAAVVAEMAQDAMGSADLPGCYREKGSLIPGCECHSSCGSCGFTENPTGADDCITCADSTHVLMPLYEDGTGGCVAPGDPASSACEDVDDAVKAATGYTCPEIVAISPSTCASDLCPTCTYKGYCDNACGFCSAGSSEVSMTAEERAAARQAEREAERVAEREAARVTEREAQRQAEREAEKPPQRQRRLRGVA